MIKIIRPAKKKAYLGNQHAAKMRANYLKMISDSFEISLSFKIGGYGVEIGGKHLLIATFIAAYFFLAIYGNIVGFETTNQLLILAESLLGGFISLILISFALGILNAIYNIPKYIMFFNK